MKQVSVIVEDKYKLVLNEDAKKGDYIDLKSLQEVDYSVINKLIDEKKDMVYLERINALKNQLAAESSKNISELTSKYQLEIIQKQADFEKIQSQIRFENSNKLKELEQNLKINYENKLIELEDVIKLYEVNKQNEIEKLLNNAKYSFENDLRNKDNEIEKLILKYQALEDKHKTEIIINEQKLENVYKEEIGKLNYSIEIIKKDNETKLSNLEKEITLKYESQVNELKDELTKLDYRKTSKNVKQTGEDLEAWCDNEVKGYMQNGLFNCEWIKDNKVSRDENEIKGSKADFIFKIYSSESKNENDLLTSICLEMKDENPDSVNKKKNEDYYKQLNSNRNKKGCKYALLVSNLELDKPNSLPIYKVSEYDDMYVVRPTYLMTFLNMVVSLNVRFKDLILSMEKERIELKNTNDLIDEFDRLKNTYLDKPLELLRKEIENIENSSNVIKEAARKIDVTCSNIVEKYINNITAKLERFEIKKITRKMEKIEVVTASR